MKTAAEWANNYMISPVLRLKDVIEMVQKEAIEEASDKATARIIQETVNGGKKAVVNRNSILSLIKK